MNLLLPTSLLTIYKSFVRPHLNYDDVIYNRPNNFHLSDKIKIVWYNAALAITVLLGELQKKNCIVSLGLR